MKPGFTDTHAHLDYEDYDADRDEVIRRAEDCGIRKIITIGIGRRSIPQSLELTKQYPQVYAAVGVHPTALEELSLEEEWSLLEEAARHPKVVAIGETGLDNYRTPDEEKAATRERQIRHFHKQLELAKSVKKPVVIHCRGDVYDDAHAILKEHGFAGSPPGVMHCFGSDSEMAHRFFELGFFISVGGIATFKNADALRDVIRMTPRDRLLLETDCPYLAPPPHRGKRNEPAYVELIAREVASLWNVSMEELSVITESNVKRLFGI
jgi:TatD DNase family protein